MITRPKNRYLLVESSVPLDTRDRVLAERILGAMAFEMGALGYVSANPKLVYQAGDNCFIIRVNRGYEDGLVLALAFIKKIGEAKVGFYTIKTSGTIRKLSSGMRRPSGSEMS